MLKPVLKTAFINCKGSKEVQIVEKMIETQSKEFLLSRNEDQHNVRSIARKRVANENQQFYSTDSEAESFENIMLQLQIEEIEIESSKSNRFGLPRNIRRSISESNLNIKKGYELGCGNCQKQKLISGETQVLLKLQEQLAHVSHKLQNKIKENEELSQENQNLNKLLDSGQLSSRKSLLSRVLGYSPPVTRRANVVESNGTSNESEMAKIITSLDKQISEYQNELQSKNRKIQDQIDQFKLHRRDLRRSFPQKTDIQREILEEASNKCKGMEEQLNTERQLRVKRETEISHLHNYVHRKEKYFRNELSYREELIERLKSNHSLEITVLVEKIKQKDQETIQASQKYEAAMENLEQKINSSEPDLDKSRIDRIRIQNLEQDLQLKMRQLGESNFEIEKLEKDLKAKHQELELALSKLAKRDKEYCIKEQLNCLKTQIAEMISNFEEEDLIEETTVGISTGQNSEIAPEELEKVRFGDKEEAE